jgi:hypothetical protein
MKRFLIPVLLAMLAACSNPSSDSGSPSFAPAAFELSSISGLARHSSGVYVAGNTLDNDTYMSNAFIRKYDGRGTVLWSKTFGPLGYNEPYVQSLASDSSGNAYSAGTTDEGQYYAAKLFLRKHTPSGRVAWTVSSVAPGIEMRSAA